MEMDSPIHYVHVAATRFEESILITECSDGRQTRKSFYVYGIGEEERFGESQSEEVYRAK